MPDIFISSVFYNPDKLGVKFHKSFLNLFLL